MDWCVKPFAEANHLPVAALDGDTSNTIVQVSSLAGEKIDLDTSVSKGD